jgi:hypothetical protein
MAKQNQIDLKKYQQSLKKCEDKLSFAIQLLRDIDMKLTHIIERLKDYQLEKGE